MNLSTHDPWTDRLSEYLDGEMRREDREALERHVADCAACAVALAELKAVVERARTLEDRAPAEDLWSGIKARIAPAADPRRGRVIDVHEAWWRRRLDLSLPQLAAAALVLALLSAGAMWLVLGRSPLRAPVAGSAPAAALTGGATTNPVTRPAPLPEPTAGTATVAATAASNPRYDQAVAELEQALAEGRGRLDPRTLRILEQNLRTIDKAIDEARRAVDADPANEWLRSHLASTMKRKVDLLRTATMLTAGQG
jgi:tetratricopeptide (TPR) repeat protein